MFRERPNRERALARRGTTSAFTVTELMVAVALMSLIVFALYAMFNQVQKALRANEAQVDSTERGRGVLELVSRDLEGARSSGRSQVINLWVAIGQGETSEQEDLSGVAAATGGIVPRTNLFDHVYYQGKQGKTWQGMGFVILQKTTNSSAQPVLSLALNGMGTLYRYQTPETNREVGIPTTNLYRYFHDQIQWKGGKPPVVAETNTMFSQVADGIVHFKVTPYDTDGHLMAYNTTNVDSNYRLFRATPSGQRLPASNVNTNAEANAILQHSYPDPNRDTIATFRSNALPAYVELELGILEPDAMRQYNQILKDDDGNPNRAKPFLAKRISKVQIFRKRIPLRTVVQ